MAKLEDINMVVTLDDESKELLRALRDFLRDNLAHKAVDDAENVKRLVEWHQFDRVD